MTNTVYVAHLETEGREIISYYVAPTSEGARRQVAEVFERSERYPLPQALVMGEDQLVEELKDRFNIDLRIRLAQYRD